MEKQGKEFMMPSGAKLHVSMAPFEDADELKNAILKSANGLKVTQEILGIDMSKLASDPGALTQVMGTLINAATSPAIKDAVFRCATRASYDNRKIDNALFDDPKVGEKAREDYYTICMRIAEVNVLPFFKKVFSRSRKPSVKPAAVPA